jgi:hypothetical protein
MALTANIGNAEELRALQWIEWKLLAVHCVVENPLQQLKFPIQRGWHRRLIADRFLAEPSQPVGVHVLNRQTDRGL